jgi:hypothetical protein
MLRIRTLVLSLALIAGVAATANATSISYTVDVGGGAMNGNPVTHVAILESNGTESSLSFGFSLNVIGSTTLTHDSAFVPTSSLIVGLDLPGVVDPKTHIVFFTNPAFAYAADGLKFSVVFPHTHHDDFAARLLAAEGGDAANQAWLLNFFLTGDGAAAAFAPGDPTIGVEFTDAGLLTPEPTTLVLFGLGGVVAAVRLRRRNR